MKIEQNYTLPQVPAKAIFRAYDIRGIVGDGIDESTIYALGLAIGSEITSENLTQVVVGRDARKSSSQLIHALNRGLLEAGLEVVDVGEVSSPVLYFSTYHLNIASGVMLTASHNPPEYNGLKIVINGTSLTQERITHLYQRIVNKEFTQRELGKIKYQNTLPDYYQRILRDVTLSRKLKVVIDCGNGIAGKIAPMLFSKLGCDVVPLYCDVDGTFPNHIPDPSVASNMVDLQKMVVECNADLGLAFDGDADRVGVVTEKGQIIWPDQQMLLFSQAILQQHPGEQIIFDVKCTANLAQKIDEWGGVPVMWQTGHSLLKNKLHQENAPLAGEMSGHIFFNDRWYGFDDGLYVGARLLEILTMSQQTLSELFAQFPQAVNTPELKLSVPETEKFALMEKIKANASFPEAKIVRIDGLRIEYPYGWGLVRASNTSPCLTLRFEADTLENLNKIRTQITEELQRLGANNATHLI